MDKKSSNTAEMKKADAEIDFFDEKVEQAHKEINKMASEEEYYDEEEIESDIDIRSVEMNKMKITVGP